MMPKYIQGMPVTPGIACGTAFVIPKKNRLITGKSRNVNNPHAEIRRFEESVEEVKKELQFLKENLRSKEPALVDVQSMIIEDAALIMEIKELILKQKIKLEAAIEDTIMKYNVEFKKAKNKYFRDKVLDVKDVLSRIKDRSYLEHERESLEKMTSRILVSEEILPSVMFTTSQHSLVGIVTVVGGLGSHAIVLARSFGIPAVGVPRGVTKRIKSGAKMIIDGGKGLVHIDPDDSLSVQYQEEQAAFDAYRSRVGSDGPQRTRSKDGSEICVYANCGTASEVIAAREQGADGVGLFRTEFVFHSHTRFPTEDEQYEIYKNTALQFGKNPVVIRTLDIGGDKTLPYFLIPKQMNPYLGWRSLKISFDHPGQFKTQIKAILRAGCHGNIKILFPMVTNYSDASQCKAYLDMCKAELEREGKSFDAHMAWGAMLETPSSVVCFDHIANEADFLSIGTNDLIQHVLVVDRDNPKVSEFYVPHHPAVVAIIKEIIDKAARLKKPVTLCGEMGRHPYYAALLLGLGLRHLSMAPTFIPMLKDVIRHIDLDHAGRLAQEVLEMKTSDEVFARLQENVRAWCPDVEKIIN